MAVEEEGGTSGWGDGEEGGTARARESHVRVWCRASCLGQGERAPEGPPVWRVAKAPEVLKAGGWMEMYGGYEGGGDGWGGEGGGEGEAESGGTTR